MSNSPLGKEGRTLNLQLKWPGIFLVKLPVTDKLVTSVTKAFIKYSDLHGGIISCCSQTLICSREISFFLSSSLINKCAEAPSVFVVLALECNQLE